MMDVLGVDEIDRDVREMLLTEIRQRGANEATKECYNSAGKYERIRQWWRLMMSQEVVLN